MARKWLFRTPVDFCRHPDDFPRYPDFLPDPDGLLASWFDAVEIQIRSALEWHCLDAWQVGPRTLDDSFWFCFPKGRGEAVIGDSQHLVHFNPGDLILIPEGTRHWIKLKDQPRTNLLVVHFHAALFGSIDFLDLLGFPFHVFRSPSAPFERISHELIREAMVQPPGWQRTTAAHILQLLLHLTRHHGSLFRSRGKGNARQELLRLLPSLKLVAREFSNPRLTVGDMAHTISVSEVHLRKLLHRLTGMSPVIFLQRHRIQHACLLLRTTPLSVKQVAEQCGFSDIPFFYRVFKQRTGRTPVIYRNVQKMRTHLNQEVLDGNWIIR